MSKGKQAKVGQENIAANGYAYVKTSTGWRLKHHLVAEKTLGRPLTKDDRVSFKDNDRTNFDPENIIVAPKMKRHKSQHERRINRIEEIMTDIVEDAEDKWQALQDIGDALGNVRSLHGFSSKV